MFRIFCLFILIFTILFAQPPIKNIEKNYPPQIFNTKAISKSSISDLVNQVNYDSLYNILSYLEQEGVRRSGGTNQTLNDVRDWIMAKLTDFGYTVSVQDVYHSSTYHGQNIIIEKTGITYPDEKIIVGAHYDSVPAGPGVNDNGSGVAALLEIARILSETEIKYSVIMVWFTGEEHGYYGSSEYAQQIYDDGMNVKIMFNMDQIGGISNFYGDPYEMTTITCERDERTSVPGNNAASHAYTDTLALMTNTYTPLTSVIDRAYGSDYIPFEDLGYVITGYYEYIDSYNPYYHSDTDILENMDVDYLKEVTKGAVAFTSHIAKITSTTGIKPDNVIHSPYLLSAYPNPFNPQSKITYTLPVTGKIFIKIYDFLGREISTLFEGRQIAGEHQITWNAQNIPSGIYFVRLQNSTTIVKTLRLVLLK